MKVHLLDVNLLIALAWPSHVHHELAQRWFAAHSRAGWATCPLTQLGLVRISSNPAIIADAVMPGEALALLERIVKLPGHQFWPDELSLYELATREGFALGGHRQLTDAYLLALAVSRGGKLATLDRGLRTLAKPGSRAAQALTVLELS